MAEDILVRFRARAARQVGKTLLEAGLPVLATYWDYWSDDDVWRLHVLLAKPMSPREFVSAVVDLSRAGRFPEGLDAGDLSATFDDFRAAALVRYQRMFDKKVVHVKSSLLDGAFFDEAVLGFVSEAYMPAPYHQKARA